jgi:hypothetical protein
LLEKLFIGVEPDERVEQALLRFAQTADREFVVENGEGQLIGTLALLDLVTCGGSGRAAFGAVVGPSQKRSECSKDELKPWGFQLATNKVISAAASPYDLRARR